MSETPLSERQAGLLAVVAEGGGDWDATVSSGWTARMDMLIGGRAELRELDGEGLQGCARALTLNWQEFC